MAQAQILQPYKFGLSATVVTACILHVLVLETEGEDEDYEPSSDESDGVEDEDFWDNDIEEEDNEGRIIRDRIWIRKSR